MKNEKIKEQGFTLIEVIIAMGILAVGLLAMASMQVMAIKTNGKANRITEATTVAMDNLEQIRSENDFGNPIDPTDFPATQGFYTVTTAVTPGSTSTNGANSETVTVTINGPPHILGTPIILNGIRTSGI
ncbi:prepilin-type N-terminal cleavage/methylation domain-containing protein [Desulfococcaceae bacterium HSG7]|nr:prepilin-type N-terminal cleavage/methylation domain-containing protein [Desulfococcaceae bacterium HSG7]